MTRCKSRMDPLISSISSKAESPLSIIHMFVCLLFNIFFRLPEVTISYCTFPPLTLPERLRILTSCLHCLFFGRCPPPFISLLPFRVRSQGPSLTVSNYSDVSSLILWSTFWSIIPLQHPRFLPFTKISFLQLILLLPFH